MNLLLNQVKRERPLPPGLTLGITSRLFSSQSNEKQHLLKDKTLECRNIAFLKLGTRKTHGLCIFILNTCEDFYFDKIMAIKLK